MSVPSQVSDTLLRVLVLTRFILLSISDMGSDEEYSSLGHESVRDLIGSRMRHRRIQKKIGIRSHRLSSASASADEMTAMVLTS
jgi:hypothetical protein